TRRGGSEFTVMLDAHLDEIGLIVNYVDERGFLHFATLGGWDTRILPAQAVMVRTRDGRKVRGVIGSQPPHILKSEERDKPIPLESLFIDVGASSADQAAGLGIRVGDPVVLGHSFEVVREGWVLGKAFDDRAGCAVLVKVLEELAGVVSIPVRYIHSPVSLMWLDDFEQVVRLVTAFAREAKGLFA